MKTRNYIKMDINIFVTSFFFLRIKGMSREKHGEDNERGKKFKHKWMDSWKEGREGGRETKCASQERDERTRMFKRTLPKGSDLSSGSNDTTICVTPNRLLHSQVLTCRDRTLDDLRSTLFYRNLILPLSQDLKPSEGQGSQEWMNQLNPQLWLPLLIYS